jgi:hypothetical protein
MLSTPFGFSGDAFPGKISQFLQKPGIAMSQGGGNAPVTLELSSCLFESRFHYALAFRLKISPLYALTG